MRKLSAGGSQFLAPDLPLSPDRSEAKGMEVLELAITVLDLIRTLLEVIRVIGDNILELSISE